MRTSRTRMCWTQLLLLLACSSLLFAGALGDASTTFSSPAAAIADSSTAFSIAGLFGAESNSIILGTIGDYPSDASIHAGGYGSLISAIGPSPLAKEAWARLAAGEVANTRATATAQPGAQALAQSWRNSMQPGVAVGYGVPVAAAAGAGGVYGAAAAAASGYGASAVPYLGAAAAGNSILSSLPPSYTLQPTLPGYAVPGTLDPWGGFGSHAGLGGMAEYAAAAGIVGPAYGVTIEQALSMGIGGGHGAAGKGHGGGAGSGLGHGGGGSHFMPELDAVSATAISSRIAGIPQAVAGGRTTGGFGTGGPFKFGLQTVSAWTEAPDFTRNI